jgi:hypothetical protein
VLLELELTVKGYRKQALPLKWELIDADTGEQVGESQSTIFRPEVDDDTGVWPVWIPLPTPGNYRVRVVLARRGHVVPLASLETPPFVSRPEPSARELPDQAAA